MHAVKKYIFRVENGLFHQLWQKVIIVHIFDWELFNRVEKTS